MRICLKLKNLLICSLLIFYFLSYICLLSSLVHSYAEKAENPALCVAAVRHYWNTCLPLTQTPEERWQLQEPLEKILIALVNTNTKHANVCTPIQPYSCLLIHMNSVSLLCWCHV